MTFNLSRSVGMRQMGASMGVGGDVAFTLVANAITMTGPTSGTVSIASTPFTVAANGPVGTSIVVTMADGGGGGTFKTAGGTTITTVTLTTAAPSATFTYTPATTGAKTISVTNNQGLSNPTSITYTSGLPIALLDDGRYRSAQDTLFADVAASTPTEQNSGALYWETPARGSVSAPKSGFGWQKEGPSYTSVDAFSEWDWTNPGGDWENTAGTAQSTSSPHFTLSASTDVASRTYTLSATVAVNAAFSANTWNAWIVKVTSGSVRSIVTRHHATLSAPSIAVTYDDGSSATLACTCCTRLTSGTAYVQTGADLAPISESVALEFDKPAKPVSSATMSITLTAGSASTISGFLAKPPLNTSGVSQGIAASYLKDSGLGGHASILMSQPWTDATTLSTYIHTGISSTTYFTTSAWSPDLFGLGAEDLTKLPTAYQGTTLAGKWFTKLPLLSGLSKVESTYSADGFTPVAPGVGALRVSLPKPATADGGVATTDLGASDLFYMFDKSIFGFVDDVYVRFYYRFASSPKLLADTKMFRDGASSSASYANIAGKFGIGVHHLTQFGGQSGTGGGNLGWTNRMSVEQTPLDIPVSGWHPGIHSYDMNVPTTGLDNNMSMGQMGGFGASLYPNKWYCIEVRCKLNTWTTDGSNTTDGVMETWVDGVKTSSHTGWSYRKGPLNYTVTDPVSATPPCREIGANGLWLNEFQGGNLSADIDRVAFYSLMAAGTSRIGPANLLPSWVPAAGGVTTLTQTNGRLTNTFQSTCASYYSQFYHDNINDYSTTVVNPYYGAYGALVLFGGGHSGTNNNSVTALKIGETCTWERLTDPSHVDVTDANNDKIATNGTGLRETTWGEYTIDGQPCSAHTYSAIDVIGPDDGGAPFGTLITVLRGAVTDDGGLHVQAAHQVDFNDLTAPHSWARRTNNVGSQSWQSIMFMSEHVPDQNRIYYEAHGNGTVAWLDLDTNTYHYGTGSGRNQTADSADTGRMFYVTSRRILVMADTTGGNLRLQYMDVSVSQPSWVTSVTLSQTLGVPGTRGSPSVCWCEDNSKIIVGGVDGVTNGVYEITIPTVLSSTWTVAFAAFNSGTITFGTDSDATALWGYKRWSYNKALKCIMFMPNTGNGADDVVYIYRPRGT